MKKQLLFSTGIALFTAILVSGGCKQANCQMRDTELEKVTIYLRSVVINNEKHLLMFDTHGNSATDSLITGIKTGGTIFWKLEHASGIKKIEKIYSPKEKKIFKKDATSMLFGKSFKLEVPEGLDTGTIEKYFIEYIDQDDTPVTIDPYIRID